MAKLNNSKTQIRQNEILNFILNYPGEYSIEEIAQIFDVSTKTIKSTYKKEFEKQGIFLDTDSNKHCIIKKINGNIDIISSKKFSKEEIKKYYIVFIVAYVYHGKVLYSELVNSLLDSYFYDKLETEKEISFIGENLCNKKYTNEFTELSKEEKKIQVIITKKYKLDEFHWDISIESEIKEIIFEQRKIYIIKLINQLIKENILKKEYKYIHLIVDNPLVNIDEYRLQELLVYLSVIKEIHPKASLYKRLFTKINMLCGNFKSNYITVDKLNGLSIFDELKVKILTQAIYNKKCISFLYKKNNSEELNTQSLVIPLGIVYNFYKDQWYLNAYMGKGKRQEERMYRLDKILNIEILQEEGYGNFHKTRFEDALGVNPGKLVDVQVYFENEEFIKRKLKIYCKGRKNSKLIICDKTIILKDKISGITEFESWIRGFGKSAKCVEPEVLVNRLKRNLDKLKERYKIYE